MVGVIAEEVLLILATVPLVFLAGWSTGQKATVLVGLFLGLLFIDQILSRLPYLLNLSLPGTSWNWAGKILSLVWPILFVWLSSRFDRKHIGLTFQHRKETLLPASILTVSLIALAGVMNLVFAEGSPSDVETTAFQATMPGLAEELVYRGVYLAILDRAYEPDTEILGAPVGWGVLITSVVFGFGHGLSLDGWTPTLTLFPFAYSVVLGTLFAWLRERTESLVFPVVAHNGFNVIQYLVA